MFERKFMCIYIYVYSYCIVVHVHVFLYFFKYIFIIHIRTITDIVHGTAWNLFVPKYLFTAVVVALFLHIGFVEISSFHPTSRP